MTTLFLPARLRASLPILGGVAACAACCAIPLLVPALLSLGLGAGLVAWLVQWKELLAVAAVGVIAAGVLFARWRARSAATACASDGSCGCGPASRS